MIIIKYKTGGETIIVEEEFITETDAGEYVKENLSSIEDKEVWYEEILHEAEGKFNTTDIIDKWIWIVSPKKKERFPYGVIKSVSEIFVTIQTRESQEDDDFPVFRLEKIKDLYYSKKADFRTDGLFVESLKEFI